MRNVSGRCGRAEGRGLKSDCGVNRNRRVPNWRAVKLGDDQYPGRFRRDRRMDSRNTGERTPPVVRDREVPCRFVVSGLSCGRLVDMATMFAAGRWLLSSGVFEITRKFATLNDPTDAHASRHEQRRDHHEKANEPDHAESIGENVPWVILHRMQRGVDMSLCPAQIC